MKEKERSGRIAVRGKQAFWGRTFTRKAGKSRFGRRVKGILFHFHKYSEQKFFLSLPNHY